MTNVTPAIKRKIVKKRTAKFVRHQSDQFIRIRHSSWRKPRGIDSRMRRRFKGNRPEVKIGYGTKAADRFVLRNGFKKFTVNNVSELELLLMHNRTYAAEIGHAVGTQKRKLIIARAAQLNVKVCACFPFVSCEINPHSSNCSSFHKYPFLSLSLSLLLFRSSTLTPRVSKLLRSLLKFNVIIGLNYLSIKENLENRINFPSCPFLACPDQ